MLGFLIQGQPRSDNHKILAGGQFKQGLPIGQGETAARGLLLGNEHDFTALHGQKRHNSLGCRQPAIAAAGLEKRQGGKAGGSEIPCGSGDEQGLAKATFVTGDIPPWQEGRVVETHLQSLILCQCPRKGEVAHIQGPVPGKTGIQKIADFRQAEGHGGRGLDGVSHDPAAVACHPGGNVQA